MGGKERFATITELSEGSFILSLDDQKFEVHSSPNESGSYTLSIDNRSETLRVKDETEILLDSYRGESDADSGIQVVHAPMPGLVLKTLVQVGDHVNKGDGLLILEAMKMENEIKSGQSAVVEELFVVDAQAVSKGEKMLVLHLDS